MIFRAGIENNYEGRTIGWALEHPGCFTYAPNASSALLNLERALDQYATWILHHEQQTWLNFSPDEVEIKVDGTWDVYFINDELDKVAEGDSYSVDSFFPYDWKPLTKSEIEHALKLLEWSRDDLLKTLVGLREDKLNAEYPGERWSISGVLRHVGGAEWWYMDRLGLAFPRPEVPEAFQARLDKVRKHFRMALPRLEGVKTVIGVEGEFWSPRKILRRALWHERDHTEHIRKLIAM